MAALLSGFAETGLTTAKFVRFRRSDGFVWSTAGTPGFLVYNAANIADYGIAATEVGATGRYTATDPAETTEGDYVLVKAAGASLVVSDLTGGLRWQDTVLDVDAEVAAIKAKTDLIPASPASTTEVAAVLAAVQAIRLRKNVAVAVFPFKMVLSSDHLTGATGKTITATRSIDGAAFAACTNSPTEISGGDYTISLSAADRNGNAVIYRFANTDCDTLEIVVLSHDT